MFATDRAGDLLESVTMSEGCRRLTKAERSPVVRTHFHAEPGGAGVTLLSPGPSIWLRSQYELGGTDRRAEKKMRYVLHASPEHDFEIVVSRSGEMRRDDDVLPIE